MKIGIFGAGAVGCYVGGRLQLLGEHEVVFLGRQSLLDDMEVIVPGKPGPGILLSSYEGEAQFIPKARLHVSTAASALRGCEVILVCTKSGQTQEAAEVISTCGSHQAVILSLQNGVGNPKVLQEFVHPSQQVLAGIVEFNVVWGPGASFHLSIDGRLFVEDLLGVSDPIVEALSAAGFTVEARADILSVMYAKLALNMINGINALSGVPAVVMLADRNYRLAWALCVDEILQVYDALHIQPAKLKAPVKALPYILRLPTWLFWRVARSLATMDSKLKLSMLQDLEKGKPTEVGYIHGEVVRMGRGADIPTPVNERVCDLIRAAEHEGKGSPKLSGDVVAVQLYRALRGELPPGPIDLRLVRQSAELSAEEAAMAVAGATATESTGTRNPVKYVRLLINKTLASYGIPPLRLAAFAAANAALCAGVVGVSLILQPSREFRIILWASQYVCVVIGILWWMPPVRQDPTYHGFCDKRVMCRVFSFWHVLTSILQSVCGIPGLIILFTSWSDQASPRLWLLYFTAFVITAVGQTVYHLRPSHSTLILDRFPECTVFMSVVCAILSDCVGPSHLVTLVAAGLLALGVAAPLLSECLDDLRLFLIVTYYSLYAITVLVIIFPVPYTHWPLVLLGVGWYASGKLLYLLDRDIFRLTRRCISGHSIMHLFNGMSAVTAALWLALRHHRPLTPD